MFARVSKFKLKPGMREDATQLMQSMEQNILSLPGLISFVSMVNGDREGMVIIIAETEAKWMANAAQTAQLWSNFAKYIEAIPSHSNYDTLANWSAPSP